MMRDLPRFQVRDKARVEAFAKRVFSHTNEGPTYLRGMVTFADGHYRAVFAPGFFTLAEGQTEVSRSQWSNLKKRLKRHDPRVFVFKEYGAAPWGDEACLYVDFGFFAE